jgi:dTDP-4-amino-4,6-dideoxygalactose transaminase
MIANHGQKVRYKHEIVGCNSRLDNLQAAILNEKLKHLDEYIAARRKAADFYDKAFAGNSKIITPARASYCEHVFHQYTLTLEGVDRDQLHKWLGEQKIPSMIYYPIPAHKQKMFASFGSADLKMPVTDWLTERVISLPMHTELEQEQLNYIASKVLEFVNRN